MRRPTSIAPPKGELGVLTPGMGAVSTTFMAGVELVRKGAALDQAYVKRLNGTHVKHAKTKFDLAEEIKDDIHQFKKETGVQRLVMVWCGSTEVFQSPSEVHADPRRFEDAMKTNHPSIAPSMLYAWAAITSGVPFANGAPNLTADIDRKSTRLNSSH